MLNSIPIEIFKSFSKNELKSFEDFVNSPFHNKKKSVTKLFTYIKKYKPDFNGTELGRETAWKELFPGKAYNYGVMKNLIYDLTKLTEEFISVIYNKDNDIQKELGVIKFLNDRNRLKLVEKYLDKAESKYKRLKAGNAEYYKSIFDIQKIRLSLLSHEIADKHKIRPGAEFEQGTNYLMESFLISILENFVLINSLNKIHRSEIKMPMLEEVLNFVRRNESFLENLYVKVYYYILLLDREQDEHYYHLLKNILLEMEITSDNYFRYTIWENISNYITFRYHAGEKEMLKEIFELDKISMDRKIYNPGDEGKFFIINFNTILNTAITLNEFEWAERFIEEHSGKLEEKTRGDVVNLSFANICLKKKDFVKANEFLSKVKKLHEPNMKSGLKLMVLIVYYELEWFESSLNVIDSFKHLLDNEKNIQEVIKEKHRKFIKGYSMLIDIRYKKDDNSVYRLKKFLDETEGIGSSAWLERKLLELEVMK